MPLIWSQASAQKNITFKERYNVLVNPPTTTVDLLHPRTFGKVSSDPRTAGLGGQPRMNLALQFRW